LPGRNSLRHPANAVRGTIQPSCNVRVLPGEVKEGNCSVLGKGGCDAGLVTKQEPRHRESHPEGGYWKEGAVSTTEGRKKDRSVDTKKLRFWLRNPLKGVGGRCVGDVETGRNRPEARKERGSSPPTPKLAELSCKV